MIAEEYVLEMRICAARWCHCIILISLYGGTLLEGSAL